MLFFFSALGAFNGLFLSFYFGFFVKKKTKSTYFLAALLFVLSVRVTKSTFMTFVPGISSAFIQVGLSACLLIGPFLYLYIKSVTKKGQSPKWRWLIHVLPVIVVMTILGYYFPYREHRYLWQRQADGYMAWVLFSQWLAYIVLAARMTRHSFKQVFSKSQQASNLDIWLVNIIIGMGVVWLAYFTNGYTSYIVGAISFSFSFYVTLLIWVFRRRKSHLFFEGGGKYGGNKVSPNIPSDLTANLEQLFKERGLHKNSDLKLQDVAKALQVKPYILSQFLNNVLGKSFSTLINEYRVASAEEMIRTDNLLTLEAIGQECGFKSNSSFYTAFKKIQGQTPAKFKQSI